MALSGAWSQCRSWPPRARIRRASFGCAARPSRAHMLFERIAVRQNPTAAPALETPPPPAEPLPAWLVQLRESVPSTTYKKGRAYASSGRVSLLSTRAGKVGARVQGSSGEEHSGELQITDRTGESQCTCPAWNKHGPHCKHVGPAALALLQRASREGAARP